MYFYGLDGVNFYRNVGILFVFVFFKTVLYVFLPETPISCPAERFNESKVATDQMLDLHCLWFTAVLPPDVCLLSS